MKACFLFAGLNLSTNRTGKKRQIDARFLDDASKARGSNLKDRKDTQL